VRIQHAKPEGQHERLASKRDLQRLKLRGERLGMGFQVHLGNEELREAFWARHNRSLSDMLSGSRTIRQINFESHIRQRRIQLRSSNQPPRHASLLFQHRWPWDNDGQFCWTTSIIIP